jgi:hypothetical protein
MFRLGSIRVSGGRDAVLSYGDTENEVDLRTRRARREIAMSNRDEYKAHDLPPEN